MTSTVRATTYLILDATRTRWGSADPETGLKPVESVRVAASRVNRPAVLERDQIAIKVTVEVPTGAFDPITPAALVVVPEDLIDRRPIDVEAEDATEAGGDR